MCKSKRAGLFTCKSDWMLLYCSHVNLNVMLFTCESHWCYAFLFYKSLFCCLRCWLIRHYTWRNTVVLQTNAGWFMKISLPPGSIPQIRSVCSSRPVAIIWIFWSHSGGQYMTSILARYCKEFRYIVVAIIPSRSRHVRIVPLYRLMWTGPIDRKAESQSI